MELVFIDTSSDVCDAIKSEFASINKVDVLCGDILEYATGCVVSPANSYGFMDGGIDRCYVEYFGQGLADKVREIISHRPEGYLPVGASIIINTYHNAIPWMIIAPTMITPELVEATNAYRALRAVLRIARQESIDKVYCPGLTSGVGCVPPDQAAEQMRQAYEDWLNNL